MIEESRGIDWKRYSQCIELLLIYNPEVLNVDYHKIVRDIKESGETNLQAITLSNILTIAQYLHNYRVKALKFYKECPTRWKNIDELLERIVEIEEERKKTESGGNSTPSNTGNTPKISIS